MYCLARYIGHRGLAAHAPENTLAGMRCAQAAGLSWVEFDARLSADNVAVLSHDDSLWRCGGVKIKIKECNAAVLTKTPVACGFEEYANECMPTLAQTLEALAEFNMGANIEIKPDSGDELSVINAIADVIHYAPPRVIISSFSKKILSAAKEKLPYIPRAFNCNFAEQANLSELQKLGAMNVHFGIHSGKRAIKKITAAGYGAYCFTANTRAEAEKIFAKGAHGVFINTTAAW